ncbi:MAG: 4Fe-4S dicluster domain-containing protein [Candidatus Lokiarchaeota archaeon]|nr:4Fe-4S dicluster domain-containing protein [Candidatus Lokiarchaeota archaeon]MBD3340349.1 4Fe-4S dicluster domain-containing protein [Candidatus Lokiarchaeota archaeon]
MCKFCKKHAEGHNKWYLNPKGYTDELFYKLSLLDRLLGRKPKKVRDALQSSDAAWYPLHISQQLDMVDLAAKPSFIGNIVKKIGNYIAIRSHSGQVVPLEDAYKIVDLSHDHVAYPCMCKRLFKGQDEYKCLNFAPLSEVNRTVPRSWKEKRLSPGEAKEALKEFSEKGYVHAVFWWCELPQAVCICNCDNKYCYAARPKMWYDIENVYRRAEYVAEIDKNECISCGQCVDRCQFNAISLDENDRAQIDPTICFGCGQCRSICEQEAIQLVDRNTHPIAQNIW